MRIAVEGCMHGELTKMYDTIAEIEDREGYKIDLVMIKNQLTKFKRLIKYSKVVNSNLL